MAFSVNPSASGGTNNKTDRRSNGPALTTSRLSPRAASLTLTRDSLAPKMRGRFWARRCSMTLRGKTALVTGGSRGIGRGIALKLAESGAKVAVHYYQKEDQAKATLEQLRACGSDGFVVQADVSKPEEIRRIFARTYAPGGRFDDSVLNTLPQPVQDTIRKWQQAGWTPMRRLGLPADIGNAVKLLCSAEANWITGQTLEVDGGASLVAGHLPLEVQQVPAAHAA